jgi:hypothetical protein
MPQPEKLFERTGKLQSTSQVRDISAILDHVIVSDMTFAARQLASGIVLLGDDGKSEGIRPRWARVLRVGPQQTDVKPGQWVYVEHGRWTRGLKVEFTDTGEEMTLRRVDPASIIGVQDEAPDLDETISTAVSVVKKER